MFPFVMLKQNQNINCSSVQQATLSVIYHYWSVTTDYGPRVKTITILISQNYVEWVNLWSLSIVQCIKNAKNENIFKRFSFQITVLVYFWNTE
jgi:hypothetical protein